MTRYNSIFINTLVNKNSFCGSRSCALCNPDKQLLRYCAVETKVAVFPGASMELAIHASFFIHPENCAGTREQEEDAQER